MNKIIHISDIHIRNNSRHDEYKEVFTKFLEFCKNEKADILVITGDLAHNKSIISPEYVSLISNFLIDISPFFKVKIIIPGNHDIHEKNRNRLDTISPIIDLLNENNHNYKLFTNSCIYDVPDSNLSFVNFSILDDKRDFILNKDRFNIGLYHGIINGAVTSLGHVLTEDNSSLMSCDLYLLGDVHKRQKLTIFGQPAYYAGSLIQQDHGESLDKGGIVYEIDDSKINVRYFNIENRFKFIDVKVDDITNIKNTETDRVRVVGSIEQISNFRNSSESKSKKYSYKIIENKNIEPNQTLQNVEKITLNASGVELLIKNNFPELCEIYGDDLFNINKKYLSSLKQEKDYLHWKINKIEWSNLFNYGKNIKIDFNNLKGNIIGIFGKNKTGKSSVIDSICYSIYGEWTKRKVNNDVYINNKENYAESYIEIESDHKYEIFRTLKRTANGSKSTVKLLRDGHNICQDSKDETEAEIIKIFGNLDDFLMTTILKQYDDISFLKEKSSSRKKILNTFLGLDAIMPIAEKVNNDLLDKKKDKNNLEFLINKYTEDLSNYDIEKINHILNEINKELIALENNKTSLKDKISKALQYSANIQNIEYKNNLEKEINRLTELSNKKKLETEQHLNDIYSENGIGTRSVELADLLEKQNSYKSRLKQLEKNVQLLNNVPCNNSFPNCKFLINANKDSESYEKGLVLLEEIENKINNDRYKDILQNFKYGEICSPELYKNNAWVEYRFIEKDLNRKVEDFNRIKFIELPEEYKQFYDNLNDLNIQLEEVNQRILAHNSKISEQNLLLKNFNDSKVIIDNNQKLLNSVEYEFNLLNSYSKIMGKNGVIIHFLNTHIENIQTYINVILSEISDLEVKLEIDGNKFDIFFKDKKSDKYKTIECASGMEEFMIGLATRLTFNKISVISKNNFIILDEPGTSLDIDNQKVFGNTLLNLLSDFDNVIIVTHLDILKDYVNKVINITVKDGYSYL